MMKMNKSLLLLLLGLISVTYGSAGQGIGNTDDSLENKEIAEAVKQEVYLKTSEAEPIEIGDIKNYNIEEGASTRSRRHNNGIGGGASPYDNHNGIGGGATPHVHHHDGIGSGVGPSHRRPHSGHNSGINPHNTGIGGGAQPLYNSNSAHRSNQQPEHRSHHHSRRQISEFNRFDSGYSKDCNTYYGKLICYKVYSNPNMPVGDEMTCWRVSGSRKNCTEVENINYLSRQGYSVHEVDLARQGEHHPKNAQRVISGQSSNYDPYKPNHNGADQYPITGNSQKGTHEFSTSGFNLNDESESFEDDDDLELVREKRGSRKNTFKNRNQLNRRNRILQQQRQLQQAQKKAQSTN